MKFYLNTAVALLTLTGLVQAEPVSVSVSANRNEIYHGESFQLHVQVKGADSVRPPDVSGIKSCKYTYLGSQSDSRQSVTIINGRKTSTSYRGRSFYYQVTPSETGKFRAGPVILEHKGRKIREEGPLVNVKGLDDQDYVLMNISSSRDTVLVDEPFEISLSIYMKRLPGSAAQYDPIDPDTPPRLSVAYLNPDPEEGLESDKIDEILGKYVVQKRHSAGFKLNNYIARNDPLAFGSMLDLDIFRNERPLLFLFDRKEAIKNGIAYYEYTVKRRYQPRVEGSFTFGPVQFKGKLATAIDAAGNVSGKSIFAIGNAVTVRVVPPPEKGRPDSYIGAVGKNLQVDTELDTQSCTVGDPLKMKLTISGDISLDNIYPPDLGGQKELTRSFRIYEDNFESESLKDRRVLTYTVRPIQSGTIELPPINFSYFNTEKRKYVTIQTRPVPIKVREAPEIALGDIIGSSPRQIKLGIEPSDPDLFVPAPIDPNPGGMKNIQLGLERKHLIILLLSPALFISVAAASSAAARSKRKRKERLRRGALNTAQRRLNSIAPTSPDTIASCGAICSALRGYLADRLDVSKAGLTPADGKALIEADTGDKELAERFSECMGSAFNSAYTKQADHNIDVPSLRDSALEIIRDIDSLTDNRKTGNEQS